jgi:predicted heme/steroid binding protein
MANRRSSLTVSPSLPASQPLVVFRAPLPHFRLLSALFFSAFAQLRSHSTNIPLISLCNPHILLALISWQDGVTTTIPCTLSTECKASYSWMPHRHTPTLCFTTYTPRTLAKFNGQDGGRILFAIAGIVFDVTGGKGFYGPGEHPLYQDGMYWRVAGRDASRSVAKQSFDPGTHASLSLFLSLAPSAVDC